MIAMRTQWWITNQQHVQQLNRQFWRVSNLSRTWHIHRQGILKFWNFWTDFHSLSWRVIIERFIALGYLLELPNDVLTYATSLTACDKRLSFLIYIFKGGSFTGWGRVEGEGIPNHFYKINPYLSFITHHTKWMTRFSINLCTCCFRSNIMFFNMAAYR